MGRNAFFVATVWLVLVETDSMSAVAVLLTLGAATEFVASGPSGMVADRWDRRQVCVLSDAARAVTVMATALAVANGGGAYALYVSAIIYSVADRIYMTAIQSMVPSISPSGRLVAFNAWSYVAMQSGSLVSALAMGLLLHSLSSAAALASISLFFFVSIMFMAWLRRVALGALSDPEGNCANSSGLRSFDAMTIVRVPRLRNLTIVYAQIYTTGMLINLLLSAYVLRELRGGSLEFGSLESIWAFGSIAANVLLTFQAFRKTQGTTIIVALIASGLVMLTFGTSPGFWSALLPVMLLGAIYNAARVLIDVEIQQSVADAHLGRMKGLVQAICMGFGLLVYGVIAIVGDKVMPSFIFAAYGGFMVVSGLLICRHGPLSHVPSSKTDVA